MGAPFINDRTHPPHSTATPTFFLQCVTWFPHIAINDLTEQVLLPAMRKELKSDLKQLCFLLLLWRVTSYSYVTAASMALIVAIVRYGSLVYWSNIYSRTGQRETAHRENTLNTSGFSNIYQQFALTEHFKTKATIVFLNWTCWACQELTLHLRQYLTHSGSEIQVCELPVWLQIIAISCINHSEVRVHVKYNRKVILYYYTIFFQTDLHVLSPSLSLPSVVYSGIIRRLSHSQ